MAIGKISPVPLIPSTQIKSMANALSSSGRTRYPGTKTYFFPKKDLTGKCFTGLDENAAHILNIPNAKEKKAEQKRVRELKEKLEAATGFDLSPRSDYWDYTKYTSKDPAHVKPVKLGDSVETYNLNDPLQAIEFYWLRECDEIAGSYESYVRGDKGPSVKYYVVDEESENRIKFERKREINKAVAANESLDPERRKKIAILMGINVSLDAPERVVYNMIDDQIKETEFKSGKYKGISPVKLFNSLVEQDKNMVNVKFTIKEALDYNIYRKRADGKIYEGDLLIAEDETILLNKLLDKENVEDYVTLSEKVKGKRAFAL